jgi:hypothetical protein
MADSETLLMLEMHRANLAESKTFEEYRDHHVAYVDTLIEREKAKIAKDEATAKFIYRYVEPETAEVVTTVESPVE